MREEYRGDTIGKGLSKADWYSICSRHGRGRHDSGCRQCMAGLYVNRAAYRAEGIVYRLCYPLWHWWVNRPNSRSRRFLEDVFPKLKGSRVGNRSDSSPSESSP